MGDGADRAAKPCGSFVCLSKNLKKSEDVLYRVHITWAVKLQRVIPSQFQDFQDRTDNSTVDTVPRRSLTLPCYQSDEGKRGLVCTGSRSAELTQ